MRQAQKQKHSTEWHKILNLFLTYTHTHLLTLIQLFFWVCGADQRTLILAAWGVWVLAGGLALTHSNFASGSPFCTVLDACGCILQKEQLCSLLISNCNGQLKLLVASFVTAGQYLWLSSYLKEFSYCYQGGFHLLISCPKCVRNQAVKSSSVLCFFPVHTQTITAGHVIHSL